MSQPDSDITARIDHLLRTDARLLAAAPLLGRVPAIVGEPKPQRKPKRKAKKLAPPRLDAHVTSDEVVLRAEDAADLLAAAALQSGEEAEDEVPAPVGAPWLKVATAKRVSPDMRTALGGEALALVRIDPDLWARLDDAAGRDAALVLALRGLHWSERKSDGADLAGLDKPPLQCWPDTAPELSHLVAALTDDPAAAARDSDAAEALSLAPSVVSVRPGEDGGFVATGPDGAISQGDTLATALRNLAEAVELNDETPALVGGSWASEGSAGKRSSGYEAYGSCGLDLPDDGPTEDEDEEEHEDEEEAAARIAFLRKHNLYDAPEGEEDGE